VLDDKSDTTSKKKTAANQIVSHYWSDIHCSSIAVNRTPKNHSFQNRTSVSYTSYLILSLQIDVARGKSLELRPKLVILRLIFYIATATVFDDKSDTTSKKKTAANQIVSHYSGLTSIVPRWLWTELPRITRSKIELRFNTPRTWYSVYRYR
jgi:hypothetical protein